ncbi:M13-type metalloendopeptidase [Candidatus Contubernalis alkaliaceticus]|uniref:M13-type metalloendopeptidase n=1 Tax=Candidatus Contubernalis alkaliaceticus TaxID=338645 RepID=UPI001F4C367B|nr:M13 family metallopeptidase [Candidatus Contubernalis alkalaceticus]UNC92463.1 M13 family metallopeptidase [Candidatus Contubernalis alkalaceticus]
MKKITALLVVMVLLSSLIVGCASKTVFDADTPLKHTQAVEIIYNAAKKYSNSITKAEIEAAYTLVQEETAKSEFATKPECYAMLAHAFDLSDVPTGNNRRIGIFDATSLSAARDEDKYIQQFCDLGIVTADEVVNRNTMTTTELKRILSKIYTYIGTNKKDDFYTAVNKEWFETAEIPAGEFYFDTFTEIKLQNDEKIKEIIFAAVNSQSETGTVSQKLGDFYKSFINVEERNRKGIEPLQKYVDMINGANTVDELVSIDAYFSNNLGVETLFYFYIMSDSMDSTKNSLYFFGLPYKNAKPEYLEPAHGFTEAYLEYLTTVLGFFGGNSNDAQALYDLEKEIATASLEPQDYYNVDKYYNPYKTSSLAEFFTGFDFEKALKMFGFEQSRTVIAYDDGAVKRSAELMTQDNLAVLKDLSKVNLFEAFSHVLGEEQVMLIEKFNQEAYGIEGEKTLEQKGIDKEKLLFPDYIGKLYVENYFSKEAKADVETMVEEFITQYQTMLQEITWLSSQTKEKAIEKLAAINVKIGYPDQWDTALDDVVIEDKVFENCAAVFNAKNRKAKSELYQPVNEDKWYMSVYEVNAYYNPMANEIVFPAGILQGDFYDINHSREENLGGIGMVIAHEITHSFDNNGAKYDKYGNANEWWTKEDTAKFEELCRNVITEFDGIEIIPGIFSNGTLTLSENIADLGGVKCALAVCMQDENADLTKFFESYARIWKSIASRETTEYYSKVGVHSNEKIRVNRVLSNFEEFYKAYDIKEGDDMYVKKARRVNIW